MEPRRRRPWVLVKRTGALLSILVLIGGFFFLLKAGSDTRPKYEVILLGSLGGDDSTTIATCLNNPGEVAGYSRVGEYLYHGFIWSASSGMKDIGSLGHKWTQPEDINDSG